MELNLRVEENLRKKPLSGFTIITAKAGEVCVNLAGQI